jgi:hypothetical protein
MICSGTAHRKRIVWLLVPSPIILADRLGGRLTDGIVRIDGWLPDYLEKMESL